MTFVADQEKPGPSGGPATYLIRLMEKSDVIGIVPWHAHAFPEAFFSQLGPRFLRRWFHAHLEASASVGLVVSDLSGEVVGYLLGTTDEATFRNRPWQEGFKTGFVGTGALLARPKIWASFVRLRARTYAARTVRRILRINNANGDSHHVGQLIYICMAPDHRSRGAGGALLEAFVGEARRSGTRRLTLVTETDNAAAQRFYLRHGWTLNPESTRSLDGRPLTRMELIINEELR